MRPGDFELTPQDLRAVASYALHCAEPALVLFEKAEPADPRPATALHAARVFAEGASRSRLQRRAAVDAHRAGAETPDEAARHAARAAGDAAASAYLHPLAKATQVRHLLGAAAHAARAAEVAAGNDPVNHTYVTAGADGAPLAAVLAHGEGPPRVYRVEPLGPIEDDPNVTDKRFPGDPTRSYRTRQPVRIVAELKDWTPPSPELVDRLRVRMAELAELGIEAMDD